uniref:Putative g-protein coupled receptor n=1 Tax=Phlebotomus kandelakii TaxID=1109342 RepID=A0A6B2EEA6_9DIPT
MWTVLETILLGIILLYEAVALHFLPASTLRCLLEPWCRELGFVICYGAIILKLYRHLIEFRTRKAHRWVVRDLDLLKYLCAMIVAVLCYLSAFTASAMDFLEHGGLLGLEEDDTNTCRPLKWDYVTQAGEMFILAFGLHLGYASRNANTQFRERQFLVASILIEFVVSSIFYTLRALYLPELSPGAIFLALFLRSQLTNTVTLGLIFLPKLWYQHKQGSHDASQHGGGGSGVGGAGACILGDPDIGDLSLSEMNPEDIRAELKRLYTQLEILKNKTLRQDNPHISKRRGGRKVAHRRFSLQKKGSKDKALSAKHRSNRHNAHDMEVTEAEPSRTPEDSVCSGEGPTDTAGEMSAVSISK